MNKFIMSLKKLIYWLTVILPLIDGIKTTVGCVKNGIEQGKADVEAARERANEELFKSSYCDRLDRLDDYLP